LLADRFIISNDKKSRSAILMAVDEAPQSLSLLLVKTMMDDGGCVVWK
jgi:hypothetical protein